MMTKEELINLATLHPWLIEACARLHAQPHTQEGTVQDVQDRVRANIKTYKEHKVSTGRAELRLDLSTEQMQEQVRLAKARRDTVRQARLDALSGDIHLAFVDVQTLSSLATPHDQETINRLLQLWERIIDLDYAHECIAKNKKNNPINSRANGFQQMTQKALSDTLNRGNISSDEDWSYLTTARGTVLAILTEQEAKLAQEALDSITPDTSTRPPPLLSGFDDGGIPEECPF